MFRFGELFNSPGRTFGERSIKTIKKRRNLIFIRANWKNYISKASYEVNQSQHEIDRYIIT